MAGKIRKIAYRYSVLFVSIATIFATATLYLTGSINELLKKQDSLISVATALAGFLFTGQGILLTLSPENRFLQMAIKYKYIEDVHHHCKWSEIPFLISVLIGFLTDYGALFIIAFVALFLFALTFSIWALCLFGTIVKYYSKMTK